MKSKVGQIHVCLRDDVPFEVGVPEGGGRGPKGNPSSAGQNHHGGSKSKRDGDRKKRAKGRH